MSKCENCPILPGKGPCYTRMFCPRKILVCGGRNFDDYQLLDAALCELDNSVRIGAIVHGGAAGADSLAGKWAKEHNIPVIVYKANWKKHGRSAGPRRNQQMLDEEEPYLVLAFPGGLGTAHMVSIAEKAGVRVVKVKKPI